MVEPNWQIWTPKWRLPECFWTQTDESLYWTRIRNWLYLRWSHHRWQPYAQVHWVKNLFSSKWEGLWQVVAISICEVMATDGSLEEQWSSYSQHSTDNMTILLKCRALETLFLTSSGNVITWQTRRLMINKKNHHLTVLIFVDTLLLLFKQLCHTLPSYPLKFLCLRSTLQTNNFTFKILCLSVLLIRLNTVCESLDTTRLHFPC